mmetsp:Transcript_62763/g.162153  ORF Transcript_62763/g.162153 Transcript_62763/m.162153 type:complete len:216 (+) Transcript_62763:408-1055(+)
MDQNADRFEVYSSASPQLAILLERLRRHHQHEVLNGHEPSKPTYPDRHAVGQGRQPRRIRGTAREDEMPRLQGQAMPRQVDPSSDEGLRPIRVLVFGGSREGEAMHCQNPHRDRSQPHREHGGLVAGGGCRDARHACEGSLDQVPEPKYWHDHRVQDALKRSGLHFLRSMSAPVHFQRQEPRGCGRRFAGHQGISQRCLARGGHASPAIVGPRKT